MTTIPCPKCGYDAPAATCPHCSDAPDATSLPEPKSGLFDGLMIGAAALPQGVSLLLGTRGIKRILIPPLLLTLLVYSIFFVWSWGWFAMFVEAARNQDPATLDLEPGWWRDFVVWTIEQSVIAWVAQSAAILAYSLAALGILWLTYSIVWEALAGPFLDEIQGRIERRWFGVDPRDALERPTDLPVSTCLRLSLLGGGLGLVAAATAWIMLPSAWWALLALLAPVFVIAVLRPEYGKWLGWVIKVEGGTLLVSLKAAALALIILVAFLWLHLVPVVGTTLWVLVSGFTVSISMLDIPFSRRGWTLKQRVGFMTRHFSAVITFGALSSFILGIPILGWVFIPACSIGGLWLICRLDKSSLRPALTNPG